MNRPDRPPWRHFRLVWILITACLILAGSTNHYNYRDNFACGGRLGAGFPVSFLCDYGGSAGSPIDSWGRVDLADFPYFSLQGLFVDGLLYSMILFVIERLVNRTADRTGLSSSQTQNWLAFLSIAFLLGYAFASSLLAANQVNFHDYILGIPATPPSTPAP